MLGEVLFHQRQNGSMDFSWEKYSLKMCCPVVQFHQSSSKECCIRVSVISLNGIEIPADL